MTEHRKAAVEARLKRKRGASSAAAELVQAHFRAQADLYGWCPRCGKKRIGTWEQLLGPCGCDAPGP